MPEFKEPERTLEEKDSLSYGLFIGTNPAGRLLFPWMQGWIDQGDHFNAANLKEMSKVIY